MLAQNFQAPVALGISDAEFESLVATLSAMDRGEIDGIDMTHYRHECGSPACICGWAYSLSGGRAFSELAGVRHMEGHTEANLLLRRRLPTALRVLFGIQGTDSPSNPTPAQAAIALRNYLTHGEPRWAEALAD